jgi:hypothetical protein
MKSLMHFNRIRVSEDLYSLLTNIGLFSSLSSFLLSKGPGSYETYSTLLALLFNTVNSVMYLKRNKTN